jgi:hypothetical protein
VKLADNRTIEVPVALVGSLSDQLWQMAEQRGAITTVAKLLQLRAYGRLTGGGGLDERESNLFLQALERVEPSA